MGNLIFGVFALLMGLLTIYLRVFKNSKGLGKLETMKETWSCHTHNFIYRCAYCSRYRYDSEIFTCGKSAVALLWSKDSEGNAYGRIRTSSLTGFLR